MSNLDRSPTTPPLPAAGSPPAHGGPLSRLRNYFLTGLVLVGPLYITINLTWWLINWVDDLMRPFIPVWLRTESYLTFRVPGVGLIVALVSLTLLGFLTANLVGRKLVELGEDLLNRMPIVRPIYKTIKQIFETLFANSGSSFRTVALVEFPAGMWSLVFLSQPPGGDVAAKLPGSDFVSAFMPCTPNPTTGFFFYVPRRDIIELDISVEAAMTLLMSAGMAQPGGAEQQKRLAAIAENALIARSPQVTPPTAPAK